MWFILITCVSCIPGFEARTGYGSYPTRDLCEKALIPYSLQYKTGAEAYTFNCRQRISQGN